MKVKAKKGFADYRLLALHPLTKKDFRALQAGKEVDIPEGLYKKYEKIFEVEKPSKKEEVK